jgi:hypothetical protein
MIWIEPAIPGLSPGSCILNKGDWLFVMWEFARLVLLDDGFFYNFLGNCLCKIRKRNYQFVLYLRQLNFIITNSLDIKKCRNLKKWSSHISRCWFFVKSETGKNNPAFCFFRGKT